MLPAASRMRRPAEFTAVVRSGLRSRRGALVVHQRLGVTDAAPRVGLIVGRSVGASVVRHRVSRRLRAQLAARLERLPATSATVVRALPPAAAATSARLGSDLDKALEHLAAQAVDRPERTTR